MSPRVDPLHDAARQARWSMAELGREIRLARVASGLSQAVVARRSGTSAAQLSRLENGRLATVSLVRLHVIAAAVGMRLHARLVPGGRRLLDQPQLSLLGRLRARVAASIGWQLEAPVPRPGDLRAVDALLRLPRCTIAVEAITRLVDVQAQLRAAQLKARDIGADRLVLLMSDTAWNRHAIRVAGPLLSPAFPITTRAALAALRAGSDPGGDCLIVL